MRWARSCRSSSRSCSGERESEKSWGDAALIGCRLDSAAIEDHGGHDPPPFGSKDVERAARRRRVHHFDADPGVGQRAGETRVRKAQACPGAEEDDLRLE